MQRRLGSPPPMRGKESRGFWNPWTSRITPAYAGKREKKSAMQSAGQDHPRLCGEKTEILFTHGCHLGSPPPMRGKGVQAAGILCKRGITPAYAGKSISAKNTSPRFKDHPRLCGEKVLFSNFFPQCQGSPPPMRGKASKQLKPFLKDRITPAYAGKSWWSAILRKLE